jgi:hypothetical protein
MGAELFIEEIHKAQENKYWSLFDDAVEERNQFAEASEKWAAEQRKAEKQIHVIPGAFADEINLPFDSPLVKFLARGSIETRQIMREATQQIAKQLPQIPGNPFDADRVSKEIELL